MTLQQQLREALNEYFYDWDKLQELRDLSNPDLTVPDLRDKRYEFIEDHMNDSVVVTRAKDCMTAVLDQDTPYHFEVDKEHVQYPRWHSYLGFTGTMEGPFGKAWAYASVRKWGDTSRGDRSKYQREHPDIVGDLDEEDLLWYVKTVTINKDQEIYALGTQWDGYARAFDRGIEEARAYYANKIADYGAFLEQLTQE